MKKELKLTGMTCPACKAIIEDICSDYSEIPAANADIKAATLTLEHKAGFDMTQLKNEIESEGDFKLTL